MASSISSTGSPAPQPVVSVAGNGSAAAAGGSVINVSQLVSELVAAAQAPQEALITNQTTAVTAQISALGTLKGALSSFQSSLSALETPSAFNAQTAISSDKTAFTANIGSGAQPGAYSLSVSQLAQAQQLLSNAFAGGTSAVVGTGTLSLSLGGSSVSVTIGASEDTLSGIAAAINTASGNPGITATVIQGTNGGQLLLSSSLTGAANTIQVTETDGGGGLAALTYSTGSTNYTEQTAAQDANFSIAGVAGTSATNTVTGALTGVTIDLLAKIPAATADTLTIATDTSTIEQNVSTFVSAYNTLLQSFNSLGGFDPSTNTAGPMMGNSLLTSVQNQLKGTLYGLVSTGSSIYTSLASIGVTTNSDGTLSVNGSMLSNALSTDFTAVSALFSGTGGIASTLNTQITAQLASGGPISGQGQALTQQENALSKQSDDLSSQMAALSASLTQQYSALNSLLSSLQTTSAYLSQAFATLPQVQGKANA